MNLRQYLAARAGLFALYAALMAMMCLLVLLDNPVRQDGTSVLYMIMVGLALLAVYAVFDWSSWNRYISGLRRSIDTRHGGMMPDPPRAGGVEQALINGILEEMNTLMGERMTALRKERRDAVEFIGGWVHEIRTPIAVSRLVLDKPGIPDDARDSLMEELDRMEGLVEQILYHTKTGDLGRDLFISEVVLGEVVTGALKKHRKGFQAKGIAVSVTDDGSTAGSDPKWLAFILDQLLANAMKYTPRGGSVSVSVAREGDGVNVTVCDTGCGIPREDLPRVFDLGFTGANGRTNASASGMGLYLARLMAVRMGHELRAASNGGTQMTLRLPDHHDFHGVLNP